jgi:predicted metal-dependent RNase
MEYFKNWASDNTNTIIFVGYQAEGTLGRRIQRGLSQLVMNDKGQQITVDIKMNLETCDGFSGHSDRKQLLNYIGSMDPKPERIIIGHGEESKCIELASTLHKRYGVETRVPYNLETIRAR